MIGIIINSLLYVELSFDEANDSNYMDLKDTNTYKVFLSNVKNYDLCHIVNEIQQELSILHSNFMYMECKFDFEPTQISSTRSKQVKMFERIMKSNDMLKYI